MQQGKQPLRARLQLLARLTLNAGKHPANQPARLAHLDHGNDRAILVQGHEGPAQIVRLGHRGTPSIDVSDEIAILAARPIASLPECFDGFRLEPDPEQQRADVILDRPPLNIVTMTEREQMRAVFEALDADARIRVVVLRAAGEHFSSSGEISGFLDASPEHLSRLAWNIAAPARCRKPVIAASRGYCFGVGFELALACDFRIVSETCLYSLPEQRLGQIPGSGGAARLQRMVGVTRAKDIVMRSRRIPGYQAHEWGIATECVADPELEAATNRLVEELRGFPPLAQRTAKKLLNDIEDENLSLAIEL